MSEIFNVSTNPHVRSGNTTQTIMRDVLIALTPASIFGIVNFGLDALLRIVIGIVTCVACEALYQYFMHKKVTVTDLSAAVTGLLIALNIPSTLNVGFEIVGCVFAIIVVKQLFGGLGQNFMNPALGARCFLVLSFAGNMTAFYPEMYRVVDGVSQATPLTALKVGENVDLLSMFIGTHAGTIGETSIIALLLGALYLVINKIIDLRIPITYIVVFSICIMLFNGQTDITFLLKHLCGGGLIFGAFFMATDYSTSPMTKNGRILFGICLGVLTAIFRTFGNTAEGVSFAIIFCNLLVPLIEKITIPKAFGMVKEKKEGK